MKYYKILNNNEFIGVATSNEFIKYSPIAKCFLRSNDNEGEYIELDGILYRTEWMRPIVKLEPYVSAMIIEIDEEEYNNYCLAIEKNEEIIIQQEAYIPQEYQINYVEEVSLDFIRSSKIQEMSAACRSTIENGFDLELRGQQLHFSLDTQDQLNLMSLGVMAQTEELIPYHADGEECTFYTAKEINEIISAANEFKIYHTTYYNALKNYINALDNINDITAIYYGIEIPEEYKTEVLKSL